MFAFLLTERSLDDFLRDVPSAARVANLLQTVTEDPELRIDLKRSLALTELQRAHYTNVDFVDPRVYAELGHMTRIYFDCLEEPTDAFLYGTIDHTTFICRCDKLRITMRGLFLMDPVVMERYALAKCFTDSAKTGILSQFDLYFARKLATKFFSR